MLIKIDTREQSPLRFRHPMVRATERVALPEGDYGAVLESKYGEYEVPVYFERKSIPDLFGTLGKGHDRFRREIARAHDKGNGIIIIIEGTLTEVLRGTEHSTIKGETIVKVLFSLWVRYMVPCVFCESRAEMSKFIVNWYVAEGSKFIKNKGVVE